MNDSSQIRLVSTGNDHRVMDSDVELLRITVGDLYMGGVTIIGRIRFRPDGPLRIANLVNPWRCFVPKSHPEIVTVRGEHTPHGLRIFLEPDTRGGFADVDCSLEFMPDSESGGWMIEQHCKIVLRRQVRWKDVGVILFPDENGRPALWWEIDDPNFDGNYGPSVPMQNDWLGVYEPGCGPDTFRKHWRRKVEGFFFRERSGRLRTIRFHRGMLMCLARQNRRALPFKTGGFAGVRHTDGSGTLYEFMDGRPTFGHICEWGFDTHFWRRIPGDPETAVAPKGYTLEAKYRIRECPCQAMEKLLHGARPIEPTESEWRAADVPIYEEPVNRFATSWRDDDAGDAWPWVPVAGATWDKKVGRRKPGSLRLDLPALACNAGATWQSSRVGVTNFMNPLVPRARYRLSGYVRVAGSGVRPSLAMEFHQYAGPGTFSPMILPCEVFTSAPIGSLAPDHWTRMEVTSGPITGNVMGATLSCHLHGEAGPLRGTGTAWFDEIAFEKLD